MHSDANGTPSGLPFLPAVFVARISADKLLLLTVNTDHRVPGFEVAPCNRVNVAELRITVGVLLAFNCLSVALQAVAQRGQQLRDNNMTDPMALAGQLVG